MEYIDSWKNKNVFIKQLDLNKKELDGSYPSHWNSFIKIINSLNENIKLLDIGCGVGSYLELCKRHCIGVNYTGMDYSEDAISIAKDYWNFNNFFTMNFYDLDQDFISDFDMIHLGALLDVLPNGDDALDFLLKLNVKYVFISRMEISYKSGYDVYTAYDEIKTYKFQHGQSEISKIINQNEYQLVAVENNNILLKKYLKNGN